MPWDFTKINQPINWAYVDKDLYHYMVSSGHSNLN